MTKSPKRKGPGRPKLIDAATGQIQIRCTLAQKQALHDAAARAGLTMSQLVLSLIKGLKP